MIVFPVCAMVVMIIWLNLSLKVDADGVDYAASIHWTNGDKTLQFGAGYLSDLAESDEQFLLDEGNVYREKVGAISYYLQTVWWIIEFNVETIHSVGSFNKLESDRNQPRASNIELVWYPVENLQLAWRYETSDELEDAPQKQSGISIAWKPGRQIELAIECLIADYRNNFVTDDDDNVLLSSDQFISRLIFAFWD